MLYDVYNTDSAVGIFILIGAASLVYKAFKEKGIGTAFSVLFKIVAALVSLAFLIMFGVTLIGIAIEYTHWVVLLVLALIIIYSFIKK